MNLSEQHVKEICKIGQGIEACCYLIMCGTKGFECAKGTILARSFRLKREAKSISAQGDNCSGPPNFEPFIMAKQEQHSRI